MYVHLCIYIHTQGACYFHQNVHEGREEVKAHSFKCESISNLFSNTKPHTRTDSLTHTHMNIYMHMYIYTRTHKQRISFIKMDLGPKKEATSLIKLYIYDICVYTNVILF